MLHSISARYCQERAVQARALASRTAAPEARQEILDVAEHYEHLAQRGDLARRAHRRRPRRAAPMSTASVRP
jgi:hypothetical protein